MCGIPITDSPFTCNSTGSDISILKKFKTHNKHTKNSMTFGKQWLNILPAAACLRPSVFRQLLQYHQVSDYALIRLMCYIFLPVSGSDRDCFQAASSDQHVLHPSANTNVVCRAVTSFGSHTTLK